MLRRSTAPLKKLSNQASTQLIRRTLAHKPEQKPIVREHPNVGKIEISLGDKVTVKTPRLKFRSLNQFPFTELQQKYSGLYSVAENVRYFRNGKPWTPEQINEFLTPQLERWKTGDKLGVFAVESDSHFIGTWNNYFIPTEYEKLGFKNVVEIGYALKHQYWGNRFGTEIANTALTYLTSLNIIHPSLTPVVMLNDQPRPAPTAVVATVHPENISSVKILDNTLVNKANIELNKFSGNPRLFFYYQLPNLQQPQPTNSKDFRR